MKQIIIFLFCFTVTFQAASENTLPSSLDQQRPTGVSNEKWNALTNTIRGAPEIKLTAIDAETGDEFGKSVSIWGNRALIGSPWSDGVLGQSVGAVYVYDYNTITAQWTQTAKLTASDGASHDFFGTSVSLWGDRVLIGSPHSDGVVGDETGVAYVFDFNASTEHWSETAKLNGIDFKKDLFGRFGASVSLQGDRALIGAPRADAIWEGKEGVAHIFDFDNTTGQWSHNGWLTANVGNLGDNFGGSVSLHGNQALIGAKGVALGRGAAFVFKFNQNTGEWLQTAMLTANDAETLGHFWGGGQSVGK